MVAWFQIDPDDGNSFLLDNGRSRYSIMKLEFLMPQVVKDAVQNRDSYANAIEERTREATERIKEEQRRRAAEEAEAEQRRRAAEQAEAERRRRAAEQAEAERRRRAAEEEKM